MLLKSPSVFAVAGAIIGISGVHGFCAIGPTPVTKCANSDLTKANWDAFGIDAFLFSIIEGFGTSDNFPKFVLSQLAPKGQTANANFDCSNIQDPTNCQIKPVNNPDGASCNFIGLNDTLCIAFSSPEGGYLAANYINLYEGLRSHFLAVRQAVDDLNSQNFISNLVDKLSPQKQPIGPAVFDLIADLVVDVLPIGGEVKAASSFMKKIKIVAKATKKDLKNDGKDIISILQSNSDIDKQASATKDTLSQQLEAVAVGTQKRMSDLVAQIFGPNQDPTLITDINQIASTVAFQNAYRGGFLDDVPQVADLQAQMEKQMKTWIASQIISVLGYAMFIDSTPLADPPGQPGTVCKAEGGFTVIGGCALFRIGAVAGSGNVIDGAKQANDIFALTDLGINMNDVIANAQSCPQGSTVDFDGFLAMDDTKSLPSCMFTFPVKNVKL